MARDRGPHKRGEMQRSGGGSPILYAAGAGVAAFGAFMLMSFVWRLTWMAMPWLVAIGVAAMVYTVMSGGRSADRGSRRRDRRDRDDGHESRRERHRAEAERRLSDMRHSERKRAADPMEEFDRRMRELDEQEEHLDEEIYR